MPKYGVFSGPNVGKYGPEKTPYMDTFIAVRSIPGTPQETILIDENLNNSKSHSVSPKQLKIQTSLV